MGLRNRDGRSVDPVPFIVVSMLAFLVIYSFGPLYLQMFGITVDYGLAVCTGLFLLTTGAAYYSLVWTCRPDLPGFVGGVSFGQLWYGILILIALVVLLSLPFLLP
jgi:Flp pilus assembly protein TadB